MSTPIAVLKGVSIPQEEQSRESTAWESPPIDPRKGKVSLISEQKEMLIPRDTQFSYEILAEELLTCFRPL